MWLQQQQQRWSLPCKVLGTARMNVDWFIWLPGSDLLFRFCWLNVVLGSVSSHEITLSFGWPGHSPYGQICCLTRLISLLLFSSWLFLVHVTNIYCSEFTILINEVNAPWMKRFRRAKQSSSVRIFLSILQKLTPNANRCRFIVCKKDILLANEVYGVH